MSFGSSAGATEADPRVVKGHSAAKEAHPGVLEVHRLMGSYISLPRSHGGSSWSSVEDRPEVIQIHPGVMEAHLGVLRFTLEPKRLTLQPLRLL